MLATGPACPCSIRALQPLSPPPPPQPSPSPPPLHALQDTTVTSAAEYCKVEGRSQFTPTGTTLVSTCGHTGGYSRLTKSTTASIHGSAHSYTHMLNTHTHTRKNTQCSWSNLEEWAAPELADPERMDARGSRCVQRHPGRVRRAASRVQVCEGVCDCLCVC